MLFRKLPGVVSSFSNVVRYTTSTIPNKINLSIEEQSKILEILNGPSAEELSKLNISETRIKNIENWKNQNGPFTQLSDVLEVSGWGEKVLAKLRENIENAGKKNIPINGNKRLKYFVSPPLQPNITNTIQTAVGIHLSTLGMSWARISRDGNKVNSWNFHDFSSLPKKMLPTDTFDLAINVIPRIPPADIYIFESTPTLSPQGQSQTSAVTSHNQLIELNCMLIALLNTSVNHNMMLKADTGGGQSPKKIVNNVYYLRAKLPARLFRTLVGTEKVAAIKTVTELVENKSTAPCTPIQVDPQICSAFISQSSANKELLGQSLMLVISFMDLCVYKNPISISALSPNKRRQTM